MTGGAAPVGEALFARDESTYAAIERDSGGRLPDLSRWRKVSVPRSAALGAIDVLVLRGDIETAFVAPTPELAAAGRRTITQQADGDSCPVTTPSYAPYQGYLGPAPTGIDAPAAWGLPGGAGQNVWLADVEGGWNARHEDLPGDRITHVSGRPSNDHGWTAHGTAVLGEVAARDNDIGMVGIAPAVEKILTASIWDSSPAAAIDAAQAQLRAGDVLLIELHAIGPRGRFLPMEFWDDVYEAILVATARGVVVVEAAGNGGEDLDHRAYKEKLRRGARDSGAIMVGAGAPPRRDFVDRSRLDFSNYGSRLDAQGWGRRVATHDYGDLQRCADTGDRNYTELFAGTSSASPIVAGAALLLQSLVIERRGSPLAPRLLRDLISRTGSPQVDGPDAPASQRIGPRPDLATAIEAIDSL